MRKTNQRGFIAIVSILVISAAVLSIAMTVSMLSIGQTQSALSVSKGEDTLSFVEGCAEDALLKLRASATYSGGNITRPEGTCTVSVSSVGSIYTLNISTNSTTYNKTIEIVANRGSSLAITSWKEI